MTFLEWLGYFGIPSLIFASMFGLIIAKLKKYKQEQDAIRKGIQALLRSELIYAYNKYKEKGYAPIFAKENFQNIYENYHALGKNGVMDEIRKEFMSLPSDKPDENI